MSKYYITVVDRNAAQVAFSTNKIGKMLELLLQTWHQVLKRCCVCVCVCDHAGALGQTCQRHTRLLDIHVEQLQCNEQRFRQLESTSYDGKLIWKFHDYQRRKDAGAPLTSPPFYTGRSGYKLSVRVYPDGDGSARGTHLSLYVMVMRGDFDSLLPWPFRQSITLTVLDQSGSRNHISCSFTPDTNKESFRRPTADSNAALGFSRFISHTDLEGPRNAVYIRDDTLFIKVKVDTTGLEDL